MLLLARNQLNETDVTGLALTALGTPGDKWLLVDQALVEAGKSMAIAKSLGWAITPAFEQTKLSAFGTHGPQLIRVPHELPVETWIQALQKWVSLENTGAGLSLICSRTEVTQIAATLAYLALTTVDGDLQLHCRCADARVLANLLPTLKPPQATRVGGAISSWSWWGAQGELCTWPRGDTATAIAVTADTADHLELDKTQYATLMDQSEPDLMFSLLMDKTSELVPDARRGDFRVTLQRILHTATDYAVTETQDRLQFVVLSLATGESFHQHPGLQTTWRNIREHDASLSTEMAKWRDELWVELDHGRRPAQ